MRDIKFRAWESSRKEMIYCSFADVNVGRYRIYHLPVMQYTGLKDKNGVEIYENDIIEWNGNIFPVTVDDFHGYRFNCGKDLFCRAYAEDGKVIGNIYEHPQLAEVK